MFTTTQSVINSDIQCIHVFKLCSHILIQTKQGRLTSTLVNTAAVIPKLLALLAQVLWMHLALVRYIQSIGFL